MAYSPCSLKGLTCLITGAARRGCIGQSTAKVFAQNEAKLILLDQMPIEMQSLSDEVRAATIGTIQCDVSQEENIKSVTRSIGDLHSSVDVLVNNAGIVVNKHILEATETDWSSSFNVNVRGYALMAKHVIPMMPVGGSIINIASISGIKIAQPSLLPYSSTKAAVIQLTKDMAFDIWETNKIRVNTVIPGAVKTSMLTKWVQDRIEAGAFESYDEFAGGLTDKIIMDRLAEPEEVGKACLYYASDLSSYCTGTQLTVDGGWSAM